MRVVIIHGTNGTPQGNWLPWVADQVESTGNQAIVPRFPTPEGQNLNNWKATFAKEVGGLAPDVILVGHSIGVGLVLRLLEESDQPVTGSFLVSGFITTLGDDFFDPLVESFFQTPFNWKRIKQNAGQVFVYHGTDDPYVPVTQAKQIASELGVEPNLIPNGSHLNEGAGFTKLPQLWHDLKPLLEAKA